MSAFGLVVLNLLRRDPDLIVDCAHNEASSQALSQTLKDEHPNRTGDLYLGYF